MVERLFIGNDAGSFKFRVSLPGNAARTAALDKLVIHEGMTALTPYESGTATVAAGASTSVTLSKSYPTPPFVIIRCSANLLPGPRSFFARMEAGGSKITLFNKYSASLTIKFCIFEQMPSFD
ncbi:hypothetical protein [Rhizobium phage RHph_X2_26]|nr:hypothetical protein [Rhizobium phage RHph_X2_26]